MHSRGTGARRFRKQSVQCAVLKTTAIACFANSNAGSGSLFLHSRCQLAVTTLRARWALRCVHRAVAHADSNCFFPATRRPAAWLPAGVVWQRNASSCSSIRTAQVRAPRLVGAVLPALKTLQRASLRCISLRAVPFRARTWLEHPFFGRMPPCCLGRCSCLCSRVHEQRLEQHSGPCHRR